MEQGVLDGERQKALILITKKLFFFTFISLLVIFLFMTFYVIGPSNSRTFLVVIVFAAGLMGGFVSIQQRLPGAAVHELRELSQSWTSILLIPLNGGIFAVILHIIFVSGILKGTLFPEYRELKFSEDMENIVRFKKFLLDTFPLGGADISKLVFWSFAAGFSERLVPQIIRKTSDSNPDPGRPGNEPAAVPRIGD